MPSSPIRKRLGAFLDALIGVAERALELAGDPDFRQAVERDRVALGHSHTHLVEALEDIERLTNEAEALRESRAALSSEVFRLHVVLADRDRRIDVLTRLVQTWVPLDCQPSEVRDAH